MTWSKKRWPRPGSSSAATYDFTKADGQDYFMIFVVK